MPLSLTTWRTIAVVAAALGLFCACGLGPTPHYPPPPDLVTVSANTLRFSASVGQTSAPQHFSLANSSAAPVSINPQSQWIAGRPKNSPFQIQTDCGLTLAANASCVVTITFRPTAGYENHERLDLKFHGDEEHRVSLDGEVTGAIVPARP